MARSPLSVLDNASGFTLKWTQSGVNTILATGIYNWAGHFAPASGRISFNAGQRFGAQIGASVITDRENDWQAGHIAVITVLSGENVADWYEVKGVDDFPSSYLPHKQVYLTRYKQGSVG